MVALASGCGTGGETGSFLWMMGLVLAGCGSGVGPIGLQQGDTLTLEAWCAAGSADRCVEALTFLHGMPDQEACVLAVTDPNKPLSDSAKW